jgi:ferric-dicitrate binding protein FerR (iron transport regulator)
MVDAGDQKLLDAAVAVWTPPALSAVVRAGVGDQLAQAARLRRRRRRALATLTVTATVAVLLAGAGWLRGGRLVAPASELVRTGPGQYRLLELGDRAVAFVGENAELERGPGQPALFVRRGSVRLVVKSDRTRPFVVASPAASIAVLGTEFDVSVQGRGGEATTEVRVLRGEVELYNSYGRRRLWLGETARVRPGESPRQVGRLKGIVLDLPPEIEERQAPAASERRSGVRRKDKRSGRSER